MRANANPNLSILSISVLGVCWCGLLAHAATERTALVITVDPRVELMSIVFRLAGNPEYQKGRVESYVNDVETHFDAWREHKIVKMARSLRKSSGVSYDAVMSYAIHLTADLEPALPLMGGGRGRAVRSSILQKHRISILRGALLRDSRD